jgi:uncharacterized protein
MHNETAEQILSPCTGICTIHQQSGLCLGCGRSLVEIAEWSSYHPASRKKIMAGLKTRSTSQGNKP